MLSYVAPMHELIHVLPHVAPMHEGHPCIKYCLHSGLLAAGLSNNYPAMLILALNLTASLMWKLGKKVNVKTDAP